MDTEIRVSTGVWPWRRKFSHSSCWHSNQPVTFWSGVLVLYRWSSPTSQGAKKAWRTRYTSCFKPLRWPSPGWKVHTYSPANSIFDGLITNLLSILCILIEVLSHARVKGKKGLHDFKFGVFTGCFPRVTAREPWQYKGYMHWKLAYCSCREWYNDW